MISRCLETGGAEKKERRAEERGERERTKSVRNERKEIEMKERHSGEGRERERERGGEVCREKGGRGRGGWGWKIDGPIEKEIQRSEGESEMDVAYRQGK